MGIKKWLTRLIGTFFIFGGLFVSFTGRLITGYAISSEFQNYFSFFNYLGIIIFLLGIFILFSSKRETLEKKVDVFSKAPKKTIALPKEANYHITDPELYFSNTGFVSLEEFQRGIDKIRNDSELMLIIKGAYTPELRRILRDPSNIDKQGIAREFWKTLYGEEISVSEPGEILDEDEKRQIKNAFKSGWKNAPNSHQREVLSHYNLGYRQTRSNHGEIYSVHNPHFNTFTSLTPGDSNAGIKIAGNVIHLIEEMKKSEHN
jgi:hypothetical protein